MLKVLDKIIPKEGYDIVFWGHVNNGIDRYLPIMAGLKKKGIKTALFYQNYDCENDLSFVHQGLIRKLGLDVIDYSSFLNSDFVLKVVSFFVKLFKYLRIVSLYDKCWGMRSKLLKSRMTEKFIKGVLERLKPQINFFDNIALTTFRDYPYGSYYVKKISNDMSIRCFSVCHGGTVHIPKAIDDPVTTWDYEKIYEANDYEKEWDEKMYVGSATKVLTLGDPRFDLIWKNQIKDLFSGNIQEKIAKMRLDGKLKILYVCPNLEAFDREALKYRNLKDIVRLVKEIGNATLLIKPHPRYKNKKKIQKAMRQVGLADYFILDNAPLVCYLDHVDFIVTGGSSALQDVLPEGYNKVVIYDDFGHTEGLRNIYSDDFAYFEKYQDLHEYFMQKAADNYSAVDEDKYTKAKLFCEKWNAGGKSLDTVISDITADITEELKR